MQDHLPKIDTSNLLDQAYAILKDRIISRYFPPNQKLSIPELAEHLGISRTPIRDAVNRLEMEGLLKTVSKVGTFVTPIVVQSVEDIMDTRLMHEFWVVDKLSNITSEQTQITIRKMEDILGKGIRTIESSSLEEYLKTDFNLLFHIELIKLGGNQKNIEIYQNLMNYRFVTMGTATVTKEMCRVALDQHQAILDALRSGNREDIRALIHRHIEDSKIRLIKEIERNGGMI